MQFRKTILVLVAIFKQLMVGYRFRFNNLFSLAHTKNGDKNVKARLTYKNYLKLRERKTK